MQRGKAEAFPSLGFSYLVSERDREDGSVGRVGTNGSEGPEFQTLAFTLKASHGSAHSPGWWAGRRQEDPSASAHQSRVISGSLGFLRDPVPGVSWKRNGLHGFQAAPWGLVCAEQR